MDISELKQKELPSIPDEIKKSIAACNITLTPFDRKNDVLCKSSLQMEAGYGRFSDGAILFPCTVLCLDSRPRWLYGGFGGIHRQKNGIKSGFPVRTSE